jgi:tetratricopeptide (TPR) repeat protein
MAVGAEREALDAARFAGRAWRRGSDWGRALGWYQVARSLAVAIGDLGKQAVVLDGVANVHLEKGNLPKARQMLNEALPLALESGDRYAIGSTYHDLGAVAGNSGFVEEAIRMTWLAVQHYELRQDQLNALTLLAGLFVEASELDAAETAYAVVARRGGSLVYRLYALNGLAQVAGRRGNRAAFEHRLSLLDEAGFEGGPAAVRAVAWIDRGKGYERLGDAKTARECFAKAVEVAEANKLGQFLIQAEEAIVALERRQSDTLETTKLPAASSIEEMEAIREELVRMRDLSRAFAGVCLISLTRNDCSSREGRCIPHTP